jgi:hypothetical protein
MTDAPALLPKSPTTEPPGREPPGRDPFDSPPADRGRGLLPVLCAVGFVVLAAAIYYTWDNPQEPPDSQEMRGLAGRVAALEQRAPPDLDALDSRITALEKRPVVPPAATDAASKTELTQLASRIDAIGARADQLATRMQSADQAEAQRMALLDGRINGVAQQASAGAALTDRVTAIEARLAALEKSAGGLPALADRQAQLARVQAAAAALEAGEPLGKLPGAPPALARYATEKPPTLAGLRLAFPAAMLAAEESSIPDPAQAGVLDRMWDRVQGLVVVRQGDSVVVGNPAAGVLARAGGLLDAGDLAGAVAAVSSLTGPAAAAMAPWLTSARDLLAARQAMAALAAHA